MNKPDSLILMQAITKSYQLGEISVSILKNINLSIQSGEFIAIMGTSGSGKSTLMNLIGCLDRPTSGNYRLAEYDVATLSDDELAYIRNYSIGFVFQQFNLLPRLSALENVMLPLIYANIALQERRNRAVEALTKIGLGELLDNRPNQLSGGQQQRVAIARALANHPSILLADEPTGALDTRTSADVMDLLSDLNQQGITIVLVTHDPAIANQASRIIRVQDGLIWE